jgi:hypothetical protein
LNEGCGQVRPVRDGFGAAAIAFAARQPVWGAVADQTGNVGGTKPARYEDREAIEAIEQDAVGTGDLVFDARHVLKRGEPDVGVLDVGQRFGKGLFAVPYDIGQGRGRGFEPSDDVDLPIWFCLRGPCDGVDVEQGRARTNGDFGIWGSGVWVICTDLYLCVRDTHWVDRDIGVAGKAFCDQGAAGADAVEVVVRHLCL